jgi:hypothetical protein
MALPWQVWRAREVPLPIVLLASDRLTAPDDVFYLSWDH